MNYERELDLGARIAREAGTLAKNLFTQSVPEETKADLSPVTRADREAERLIGRRLREAFPADGIVGEEGARQESQSGRRWLIDPIDGTKDFLRGNPHWAVQLALAEGERVVAGIIYCPCLEEMVVAADGAGCFYNDAPCAASTVTRVEKAILAISGFNAAWESWSEEAIRQLTRRCWTVRCYGGSYNVIMFARAKVDIWLSGRGMEWDYAPAQVIARTLGARFVTRSGSARIDEKNCVIAAPGIVSAVCAMLRVPEFSPLPTLRS